MDLVADWDVYLLVKWSRATRGGLGGELIIISVMSLGINVREFDLFKRIRRLVDALMGYLVCCDLSMVVG